MVQGSNKGTAATLRAAESSHNLLALSLDPTTIREPNKPFTDILIPLLRSMLRIIHSAWFHCAHLPCYQHRFVDHCIKDARMSAPSTAIGLENTPGAFVAVDMVSFPPLKLSLFIR